MLRNLAFVVGYAVFQLLATTAWAAEFGTAEGKLKLCLRERWPR